MNYNIIYNKDIVLETIEQRLLSANATIVKSFPNLGVLTIETTSEEFKTVDGVISWEEDIQLEAVPHSWHKNRIYSNNLPMVETYYPKNLGEGTIVYMVDSGIYMEHEEFTGKSVQLLYSYDETFTDETGHGTAMSSLVIGNTLGVSPNATLKVVKIPMLQSIPVSSLLAAFDAILADHNTTPGVNIVNCSWTIPKSQILDTKITELEHAGLVVVAAAGNSGQAADNFSPVGLNSVLGVGASDAYDRVISWGVGFSSNWGPEVDITAPGIGVSVASLNGSISTLSGTSLATAIVSAVVAQYVTEFQEYTALQIQEKIIDLAREDLLFRNEAIYGTTPNRLVAAISQGSVFDETQDNMIVVKRGEIAERPLLYNESLVTEIATDGVVVLGRQNVNAEWMTYSNETKTIRVTPPEDLTPGKYRMFFRALDEDGNVLSQAVFRINVYANSPDENDGPEIGELYHYVDEDGTVVVTPAACSTNFCVGDGSCTGTPDTKGSPGCGCPPPSPLGTFCFSKPAT